MGQCQFRSDDSQRWWLGFGDGSDGDYSSAGNATDAPIDSSCSGTEGSTSLSATNASFVAGKPVLIHQTRGTNAGNWELNQIDSYVAGTITLKKPLINTYTDSGASQAQVIQLKQYNNFTQNSGHTLTAKAWDGNVGGIIAFLAKGTVSGNGSININGLTGSKAQGFTTAAGGGGIGFRGGRGRASNSGTVVDYCGEGTAGASTTKQAKNGSGGGAGNASGQPLSASGGGGGNGTAGTNGYQSGVTGGYGGDTAGVAGLTSMVFGGGGGGGAGYDNNGGSYYIGGGGGGGGIFLCIGNIVDVSGLTINLNGGNKGDGTYAQDGGGGSGGSCLIKAKTATLGTNKITAIGGSTGDNGAGGVGRIHLDYSVSYTGTTSPTLDATLDTTIIAGGGSLPLFFAQY